MAIKTLKHFRRVWIYAIMITVCGFFAMPCRAQTANHDQLRKNISDIAATSAGKVGVSIRILETGDTLSFHDTERYPMQSVFKFPIAVSVLRAAEKGKLSLDDKILVTKKDLRKTVSALLENILMVTKKFR